jgi:ligand-binding SRPBCC domain-containing protein
VYVFHRAPTSLSLITPPPLEMGDEVSFHLRLGPLSIPWVGRIDLLDESGFRDCQLRGPFESWVHHHRFVPLASGRTEVRDEIEVRLYRDPVRGLAGLAM